MVLHQLFQNLPALERWAPGNATLRYRLHPRLRKYRVVPRVFHRVHAGVGLECKYRDLENEADVLRTVFLPVPFTNLLWIRNTLVPCDITLCVTLVLVV
jgi:hypothetical protein